MKFFLMFEQNKINVDGNHTATKKGYYISLVPLTKHETPTRTILLYCSIQLIKHNLVSSHTTNQTPYLNHPIQAHPIQPHPSNQTPLIS